MKKYSRYKQYLSLYNLHAHHNFTFQQGTCYILITLYLYKFISVTFILLLLFTFFLSTLTFRFAIQKYFFPSNFQELPVTKPVEPDELRVHSGFDVNVEFAKGTTFDMLFTKNEVFICRVFVV